MDPETKGIYESLSCWFVNRFWGDLYDESLADDNEEAYKITISNFNSSFKSNIPNKGKYDTPYVIIMEQICKYYNDYFHRNKNIKQFIDSIYRVIVGYNEAEEHKATFTDKENVVQSVLTKTLDVFTMYIIKDELDYVREPNNKDKPLEWKTRFEIIFKNKIKQYRDILISNRHGVDLRKNEDKEMVPIAVVEKLKKKIRELYTELQITTSERNGLVLLVKKYKYMLESYINAETPMQELNDSSSDDLLITDPDYLEIDDTNFMEELSSGEDFSFDG